MLASNIVKTTRNCMLKRARILSSNAVCMNGRRFNETTSKILASSVSTTDDDSDPTNQERKISTPTTQVNKTESDYNWFKEYFSSKTQLNYENNEIFSQMMSNEQDNKNSTNLDYYNRETLRNYENYKFYDSMNPHYNDYAHYANKSEQSRMADSFFIKHFLSKFNLCKDGESLNNQLSEIKSKFSTQISNTSQENDSEIENGRFEDGYTNIGTQRDDLIQFENNIIRLAYHSCIARMTHGIIPSEMETEETLTKDLKYLDEWLNQLKTEYSNLCNHETYELIICGLVDECYINKQIKKEVKIILKNAINNYWNDCDYFINCIYDPKQASTATFNSKHHLSYYGQQTQRYQNLFSSIIEFWLHNFETDKANGLTKDNKGENLIKALETFFYGLERGILPRNEEQLRLMGVIADEADEKDWRCVDEVFKSIMYYTIESPKIDYFNGYLRIISKFGNMDQSMDILRLLIFGRNKFYSMPKGPTPNLETFEIILIDCLTNAMKLQNLNHDKSANKVEWVLKQMKSLRIGAKDTDIYKIIYQNLGVAFWEKLPWHLRTLNRP